MTALRRRFLWLAVAVLVPVAVLVWRALGSVAVERRLRHDIVAERVFDEMERVLSDLLAQEESRPFEAYGADDRLPLVAAPPIAGYFRIDPDGGVRASGGLAPLAESFWGRGEVPRTRETASDLRPGKTGSETAKVEEKRRPSKKEEGAADEKLAKARRDDGSYDVLRSLNKAVQQRMARQKGVDSEAAVGAAASAPAATPSFEREATGGADVTYRGASPVPQGAREVDARALRSAPMVGERADEDHLILYRTVVRAGRAFRQGLIVRLDALEVVLRSQVLDDPDLANSVTFRLTAADGDAEAGEDDIHLYRHRFADPFAAATGVMSLRTLPGSPSARLVQALSAFLVLAVCGGLLALYRMVGETVRFAERRSNFVAAVSHELKTPLTAIRMYGEMLRDGIVPSEEKRAEYHRHITAESERLSRLINNVLEFARLEKGARPMALVVGPVAPVLEEAITLLRPHAEQGGFVLRCEVPSDLPPARFERDALLQVVFNLVDNAIKYAAESARKEILVQARRDGDEIILSVRDHGPGVPAAQLQHIFEPFFRGERELTRQHKGTGLGLALVRGLVEGMGATLTGENASGGGFEVRVRLATG